MKHSFNDPKWFNSIVLRVVIFNIIILFVILLIAEGLFRILNIPFDPIETPSEYTIAQFDKTLGWSYIPNKTETQTFGLNEKPVVMCFDENGFRVASPNHILSKEEPSILFVGCSFTMGHGVSFEESFPGKFGLYPEVKYQIINAGVQAYGTDQSYLMLSKICNAFNIKYVVYTFIPGHLRRNINYDRRLLYPKTKFLGTKPLFKINNHGDLVLSKKPIRYENYIHSYFFDFLKIRIINKSHLFDMYSLDLTDRIIHRMDDFCKKNDARFILLNWGGEKYFNYNDIPTIHVYNRNLPSSWYSMIIPGDGHPDKKAHEYIARLLLNFFLKNNFL